MADRRARGARPSRPRSQHFLRPAFAAQLVRDAGIGRDDLVVDLGAGTGRLTAELARVARHVIAVELDPVLARRLRGRWRNVSVVEGDATRFRVPRESFRVVANLPFHRTTDLLHLLLDDPATPLQRADLVVEWGVAFKRSVPWPSSISGVVWGAFYEATLSRRLPREAFEPPPAADAGVLVFRRRAEPLVPGNSVVAYHRFVSSGFRNGAGRRSAARELDAHAWAARFLTKIRE
ncbi:MAG TPA: rRNA adenine N-6-methyltransferase family protein [Gaiellaceae bacterium]|nr:rRNA adenine N-6-methyltransferase family protein [Gaiellaceae bacterium]